MMSLVFYFLFFNFRENVKHIFECFCEVAAPVGEKQAWILQKYPDTFTDLEILKSVPKFAYPCEVEKWVVGTNFFLNQI